MTRNHLTEIEPNQTNANSALKVLYIELLGLPISEAKIPRNQYTVSGDFSFLLSICY